MSHFSVPMLNGPYSAVTLLLKLLSVPSTQMSIQHITSLFLNKKVLTIHFDHFYIIFDHQKGSVCDFSWTLKVLGHLVRLLKVEWTQQFSSSWACQC